MRGSASTGGTFTDSVGRVGAPLKKGDILAERYLIEEVLGVGGMGIVVAARHLHLDTRVAIKLLLPGPARDREFVKRFLREAHAASKLKSQHVVRVLDVGKLDSGSPYIVMELLDGKDLAAILR